MRVPTLVLLAVLAMPATAKTDSAPVGPPPCAGTAVNSPNFGCANASNLAAMIADPGDLVMGRESAGSDAVLEAAAIARLRADKVKKLRNNGTRTQNTSGGGE